MGVNPRNPVVGVGKDLTPLSRTTTTAVRNAVQPGWRNKAITLIDFGPAPPGRSLEFLHRDSGLILVVFGVSVKKRLNLHFRRSSTSTPAALIKKRFQP